MTNLSVNDMRECLIECFEVEEDYLIPATFVAEEDPAKFEKVLGYFTGDRFEKFTDPNISHSENCAVAYELRPQKFTLEIELGNSAMSEIEDIARALRGVTESLSYRDMSKFVGYVQDRNGNSVGKWELS